MDIQGLVNHNPYEDRRNSSLSPHENSGSDSQYPADSGMLQSSHSLSHRDRHETHSPHSHIHISTERMNSPPVKRPLDASSPTIPMSSAKRRSGETNVRMGRVSLPVAERFKLVKDVVQRKASATMSDRVVDRVFNMAWNVSIKVRL